MSSKILMETMEVFETSDLPEADQAILAARDDSGTDSIETLTISANEAFGRFKGAYIDSGAVDFSDKLRSSRRKGYTVVWSGEAEKSEETPLKKYQRLNCEARELQDELLAARESQKSEISNATLETMSSQVELLHKQLVSLRLEEVLSAPVVHSLADPQGAAREKLLCQLEELRAGQQSKGPTEAGVGQEKASYTLQLRASNPEDSALASLESRLSDLEASVGLSNENFSVVCMETNKKDLSQAVQVLASKTSLLDPYYLDHVEGRLGALQQKLMHLQDKNPGLDSEASAKLDTLLAVAEKSEPLYNSLGETVQRVETLQSLHAQAAEFSRNLLELETVQGQLAAQLGNNLALLNATKDKLPANMAAAEQNFASLFSRIERLQKAGGKK